MEKDYLILKRASASRPSGEWNDEDYDVLCDGVAVGRIMQAAAVPVGMSWMWTLAFGYHEDRTPSHGYAATREAAMAAFAKSWEPSDQCRSGPESATRLKVTRISSGRRNRFHRRQLERRVGVQTLLHCMTTLCQPDPARFAPRGAHDYALRWKVQRGGARVCNVDSGVSIMPSRGDEYRRRAKTCFDAAYNTENQHTRAALLRLAENGCEWRRTGMIPMRRQQPDKPRPYSSNSSRSSPRTTRNRTRTNRARFTSH